MTQTNNQAQYASTKNYSPWLDKILILEQCSQAILTQIPELPYSHFYQEVLRLTHINKTLNTENALATLKQQFLRHINQLLDSTYPERQKKQLQCLYQNIENTENLTFTSLPKPRIAIVGAGLAGLFAAYALTKYGCTIEIFESRANDAARLRPQNISFKEAETCIKPLLAPQHYAEFFKRGGTMDGDSGKLRITTGSFQDILTEALLEQGIAITYDSHIHDIHLLTQKDFHAILIAAGVHSCERLNLQSHFHPLHFPQYAAQGRTALCIAPSAEPQGYQRSEIEGSCWQRNNKSVFSGEAFQYDLQRLINPLPKDDTRIAYLKHLMHLPSIEYSFNFGNNTPDFMREETWPTPPLAPSRKDYIVKQWGFCVEPMITDKVISHMDNTLLIAIGDANGSAHPLAALGTIKFCRNALLLPNFLYMHTLLSDLLATENHTLVSACLQMLEEIYHHQALCNNHEVFWANLCCSFFSRKR